MNNSFIINVNQNSLDKLKVCFLISVLGAALETAVDSLEKGSVIAVPTDTIYGITGLAQNNEAVNRIYNIKNRSCTKPVAISVGDIEDLYKWVLF